MIKRKAKQKTKHDLPAVDFTTRLSIEECYQRLRKARGNEWQSVRLDNDTALKLEAWLALFIPKRIFRGTLTQTPYGTHFQGKLDATNFRPFRAKVWRLAFAALFVIAALAFWMLRFFYGENVWTMTCGFAGAIFMLGFAKECYKSIKQIRAAETYPERLRNKLYETLYTPPNIQADLSAPQADETQVDAVQGDSYEAFQIQEKKQA